MTNPWTPRYRTLLARLRDARTAAGLSQQAVAAKLGKPQSYISKIETGERRADFTEIEDLAAIYGRPLAYFQTRAETGGEESG